MSVRASSLLSVLLIAACSDPQAKRDPDDRTPTDAPATDPTSTPSTPPTTPFDGVTTVPAGVYVNEVAPYNMEGASVLPDWIEIYNATDEEVDLGDAILWSIDRDSQDQWAFPAGARLAAGGFLLVYCDNDASPHDGELHASFRLGREGGQVLFTYPTADGIALDDLAYGYLATDNSYARFPDGGSVLAISLAPTPGRPNGTATAPVAAGTVLGDGTVIPGLQQACGAGPGTGTYGPGTTDTGSSAPAGQQIPVVEFQGYPALEGGWARLVYHAVAGGYGGVWPTLEQYEFVDGEVTANDIQLPANPLTTSTFLGSYVLDPYRVGDGATAFRWRDPTCPGDASGLVMDIDDVWLVVGAAP